MIYGTITGTANTKEFRFLVKNPVNKFEYVKVFNDSGNFCLCQVNEIYRDEEKTIAHCNVIGFKDIDGRIKTPLLPFKPGTEVLYADDDFIREIIEINNQGIFLGFLEGRNIKIFLDPNKLLTKHVAIIAKSGSGKSYVSGVLCEEIIKKEIPLLIIDPHGEYSSLKYPNKKEEDELKKIGLTPKGFIDRIIEYKDPSLTEEDLCIPLKIKENLSPEDFIQFFPSKLSSGQQIMLYNALKEIQLSKSTNSANTNNENMINTFSQTSQGITLEELIPVIERENSSLKISLLSQIQYLISTEIFDSEGINYHELIKKGRCSILNLKGYSLEIQQLIVQIILSDLFMLRKQNKIPPFFTIIEEAHNFCPERSFGEAKSSRIIRTIASEGRKFGLGFGIISQRPARVDKNVLSQCSTQIILKTTNPNDLKAILNSVEGIDSESEKEIKNLTIGSAIVSGFLDLPLFVKVRTRQSKHGGDAVEFEKRTSNEETENELNNKTDFNNDNLDRIENKKDILEEIQNFDENVLLITPRIEKKDLKIMTNRDLETILVPGVYFTIETNQQDHQNEQRFNVLFELIDGFIIQDLDKRTYLKEITNDLNQIQSFYLTKYVKRSQLNYDKKLKPKKNIKEIKSKLLKTIPHARIISEKPCQIMIYSKKL